MATSAAVIGRQLRQQASSSRISGPVVPPTQYKGSSARAAQAAALSRARPSSFSSGHGQTGRAGQSTSSQSNQGQQQHQQQQSNCSSMGRTSSFYGGLDSLHQNAHLGGSTALLSSSCNLSSNQTGADADKNFAKFSQLYSHEFYPHPAHRAETAAASGADGRERRAAKKRDKKANSRRVFFSSRCWWVAVKAHCPGIVLVLVGTVMSVVGFYADSLSEIEAVRLENGTMLEKRTDEDLKAHLHNLTYVGPVIMGLGGMVLVAACVLTFEVRDTLGVQMAAVQPTTSNEPSPEKVKAAAAKAKAKSSTAQNLDKRAQERGGQVSPGDQHINEASIKQQQPTSSTSKQLNGYSSVNLAGAILAPDLSTAPAKVAVIEITTTTTNDSRLECTAATAETAKLASSVEASQLSPPAAPPLHRYQQHPRPSKPHYSSYSAHHQPRPHSSSAFTPQHHGYPFRSSVSTTASDIFSIDMSFVQLWGIPPSPADTELSDPEGCSLHTLTASGHSLAFPSSSRWRSRCSCSGSPTNSMVLALSYDAPHHPNQQWLPNRHSKILASVESDGLSASTASSEWDIRASASASHLMRRTSASSEQNTTRQQTQLQQLHQQASLELASSTSSNYHHHHHGKRKASRGSLGLPVNHSNFYKPASGAVNSSYPLLELPTPTSPHN